MTEIVVFGVQSGKGLGERVQAAVVVQGKADRLLDGCTIALQELDTETLEAIATLREKINPGGWMQNMIWQHIEAWR